MSSPLNAGFFRRCAALIYDGLVVIAFAMLSTVLFLLIIQGFISLGVLTLRGHEDISALVQNTPLLYWLRFALIIGVSVFFFAYFWTKSGQTIGMRAWRLQVVSADGKPLTWAKAALRSITALLGLGNLAVLLDFKHKRALQDRLTGTNVIVLSKEENRSIYRNLD
ncbi:FIG023103: Predicted transmembrane protein [Pseudoalteromonas luteoviolacea B = ATCC 29581]|nr:FIG023103: Predicted transmembrane protein [Pseudoalteromonas luteoviolacea B = ATCC 29581]